MANSNFSIPIFATGFKRYANGISLLAYENNNPPTIAFESFMEMSDCMWYALYSFLTTCLRDNKVNAMNFNTQLDRYEISISIPKIRIIVDRKCVLTSHSVSFFIEEPYITHFVTEIQVFLSSKKRTDTTKCLLRNKDANVDIENNIKKRTDDNLRSVFG